MPKVDDARSLLNPFGAGNVAGSTGLFDRAPEQRYLSTNDARKDPVVDTLISASAPPSVVRLMRRPPASDQAAAVANAILAQYGGFTADNTAANRAAILSAILWIGNELDYDYARKGGSDKSTLSPNETIVRGAGICRDIHAAQAAILSALMHAQRVDGVWTLGAPSNDGVRMYGVATPREKHAFMVYRDPASGLWNTIEYGAHYAIQAKTEVEAFAALPHRVDSIRMFQLRGFDGKPFIADQLLVDSARVQSFFRQDLGSGDLGDTRFFLDDSSVQGAAFLAKGLALDARIDFGATQGGVRLTHHLDLPKSAELRGYVHSAAGVYMERYEQSDVGVRRLQDRLSFSNVVIAAQSDGMVEHIPQLIGEHLRLSYGARWDLLAAYSFITPGSDVPGAHLTGSVAKLGLAAGLEGNEKLSDGLAFDWAVKYAHDLDFLLLGFNTYGSGDNELASALGWEHGQIDYAARLTFADDTLQSAIELGGSVRLDDHLAEDTRGRTTHYLSASLSMSSFFTMGIDLRGQVDDVHASPIDVVGLAVQVAPHQAVAIGARADINIDERVTPSAQLNLGVSF